MKRENHVHENLSKWESQGYVDKEFWKEVGAQGLIGIQTPAEVGGHGGDFLTHIITCEEQGYAAVPGNFLIQSEMVSKSTPSTRPLIGRERYLVSVQLGTLLRYGSTIYFQIRDTRASRSIYKTDD